MRKGREKRKEGRKGTNFSTSPSLARRRQNLVNRRPGESPKERRGRGREGERGGRGGVGVFVSLAALVADPLVVDVRLNPLNQKRERRGGEEEEERESFLSPFADGVVF